MTAATLLAQTVPSPGTFWHLNPRNYEVKYALEVESLLPMSLVGECHFVVGYRYEKSQIWASVINGTYPREVLLRSILLLGTVLFISI